MEILFLIFFFIIGAAVGSFLNVVIYRLRQAESWRRGRSHCPHCRRRLRWYDLLPVASFFLLRGRCRFCDEKISWQYPAVELSVGALFALGAFSLPSNLTLLVFLTAAAFFTILFVYDASHYLIPDEVSWPAIITIFLLNLLRGENPWFLLLGAVIGGGWFLVQFLISRGRWVGGGDIRLGLLLGVLLGYPLIILGLLLTYIGGSLIALALLALGRKKLGSRLPFATMLLPAALVTFLWGKGIWAWYFGVVGF